MTVRQRLFSLVSLWGTTVVFAMIAFHSGAWRDWTVAAVLGGITVIQAWKSWRASRSDSG
jgi:hypothetical protein